MVREHFREWTATWNRLLRDRKAPAVHLLEDRNPELKCSVGGRRQSLHQPVFFKSRSESTGEPFVVPAEPLRSLDVSGRQLIPECARHVS